AHRARPRRRSTSTPPTTRARDRSWRALHRLHPRPRRVRSRALRRIARMPSALSVVTETLPKSQVGMTIEVPAELVDATYERVLNRLASRAKIEGFRPGRAPRQLIEARIGPAAVREEVVETIVPEGLRQARRRESIDPIDTHYVEVLW